MQSAILGWEAAIGFAQMLTLVALYGRAKWFRSLTGWVLMSSFTIKAVIFGMMLAGRVFGPVGLVWWIVAMAVFDCVQMGWIILVARQQHRDPPARKQREMRGAP